MDVDPEREGAKRLKQDDSEDSGSGGAGSAFCDYSYTLVNGVAMADKVPRQCKPTLQWKLAAVKVVLNIGLNKILVWKKGTPSTPNYLAPAGAAADGAGAGAASRFQLPSLGVFTSNLLGRIKPIFDQTGPVGEFLSKASSVFDDSAVQAEIDKLEDLTGIQKFVENELKSIAGHLKLDISALTTATSAVGTLLSGSSSEKGTSVSELRSIFHELPLPCFADDYTDDHVFANLRVAGFNPGHIRRLTKAEGQAKLKAYGFLDSHLQGAASVYSKELGGDGGSLQTVVNDQRAYIVDYSQLSALIPGKFKGVQKYFAVPVALFVRPKSGNYLLPVAIAYGNYVVTPASHADQWTLAKALVNCADANHHELISHLAECHLVLEPFAIATPRRLPAGHAVRTLLEPHYEGTLFINNAAATGLLAAGGQVDEVMVGTIDTSKVVAVQAVEGFEINKSSLRARLQEHNTLDDAALNYPYREDGLALWDAISAWVTSVVFSKKVYATDEAMLQDANLLAWVKELASENGGRLKLFGEDNQPGVIKTRKWLAEILTFAIFTASCQHSAVNFAQADFMVYAPAVSGALYAPLPSTAGAAAAPANIDLYMPPMSVAKTQLDFLTVLGGVHYTQLGQYNEATATALEKFAPGGLAAFKKALTKIEGDINTKNKTRHPAYQRMLPSTIPQSINI